MRTNKRQRGLSIAITLIILTILVVVVFAIGARGINGLRDTTMERRDKVLFNAAEAGVQEALLNYKKNIPTWSAGIPLKTCWQNGGETVQYEVTITNNQMALQGSPSITAPDGVQVPPGLCYFLSTGSIANYPITKKVGVMVKYSFLGNFDYALAAGDAINFQSNTTVYGNIKSNKTITFSSACSIVSVKGSGNLLSAENIDVKARLVMETGQNAWANGIIINPTNIENANVQSGPGLVTPFDLSGDTTVSPAPGTETMPNPDLSVLLAGCQSHMETSINGELDLGSKVHYFPNGITFGNKASFKGTGSIVTGNGKNMTFQTSIGAKPDKYYPVNLIALGEWDGSKYVGGNISFDHGCHCITNGLVFAHGKIDMQAEFKTRGTTIAYNGMVGTGGQADFEFFPMPVFCPGFEAWNMGPGTARVDIVSWQRQ
ncbi:MAG: hypothetical protein RDV48_06030 [Candidatus Eremiobacteraeota bacterium]|nr:hypothetical protein [Candidatus Eremiobacteraeota bacterium]